MAFIDLFNTRVNHDDYVAILFDFFKLHGFEQFNFITSSHTFRVIVPYYKLVYLLVSKNDQPDINGMPSIFGMPNTTKSIGK